MQQLLLELHAARKGHFRFESGFHGDLWLDLDLLFVRSRRLQPLVVELANKLLPHGIGAICGPMVGGAFLAQAVATTLDVEFFYTERFVRPVDEGSQSVQYRLPNGLRPLVAGKRFAIVDDAINAGSAVRSTLAELRSYDGNPVAAGTLLLLGSTAFDLLAGQDIPVEAVTNLPNTPWLPSECPLCAAQVPLEDPQGKRI